MRPLGEQDHAVATIGDQLFVQYGLFAAFYASLDWQALRPLVIAIVATMPLFVILPASSRE